MKLSVLTVPLQAISAREAFEYLSGLGVEQVELGTGGYTNENHLKPSVYLNDDKKLEEFKALLKKNKLEISALSCHGNPVHPNKEMAEIYHNVFVDTCRLAQKLGVETVVTFSGCPGDCEESKYPNWVTCAWPDDYGKILDWQWNQVLIPYWKKAAAIAQSYGVKKIAFEMHPGFCVYNPYTLLRLREAVGDIIGANFDPSHLIWQGIDPVAALRELKGAVYHFHAKDTRIDAYNTAVNGVLDTRSFANMNDRGWVFRTIGYGSDEKLWRDIISTLSMIGYDGAVSIEHEDGLMSPREGLEKAIAFLKEIIIREKPSSMWWS
ncbi:MAG: sugar phosphate isomerase/epimerase [Oscillospiraceae bacterium]|nr:sugar phosphate isomerase/epimerase [Oscillospiraceae bacterium]MDD4413581.1 sugar phosphate isomerase/epimerase [Oscillospiraceae bacterium]